MLNPVIIIMNHLIQIHIIVQAMIQEIRIALIIVSMMMTIPIKFSNSNSGFDFTTS